MTCRCRTPQEHAAREADNRALSVEYDRKEAAKRTADREAEIARRATELAERSPNPDDFRIVDYEQVDNHLVIKVRYPSCKRCSYDACKVMVFLGATMKKALAWTRIDPHFREEKDSGLQAPSPAARFPASADGWSDAVAYARSKARP
jgi:hypothetical protein